MNTGKWFTLGLALAVALTTGCGSGGNGSGSVSNPPNAPQDDFAGAWELTLTSAVYPAPSTSSPPVGNVVLVETILTQNGNALSASGSQVQAIAWNEMNKSFALNGACGQTSPGVNTVTGNSVSSDGKASQVVFTFNIGGIVYNATGFVDPLAGTLTGTYTGGGSGACAGDAGVLSGKPTTALSGGYGGILSAPYGSVTMNFVENNSYAVTVTGAPNVTLSGTAVGNTSTVAGSINGVSASFLTFYDPTGTYTGITTGGSVVIFDSATGSVYGLI
jgi:hypothetical protein